jgi:hypothetical protein
MKPQKGDISGSYTSDAILNAPDIFFDHLAKVYRSWIMHGTVTMSLLSCAFLPLFKGGLKDPANTDSYRAIAGSSLLLILFDNLIILLWGDRPGTDSLQFGFKSGTSTTEYRVLLACDGSGQLLPEKRDSLLGDTSGLLQGI